VRPTMRFVAVKSAEKTGRWHGVQDTGPAGPQRTQTINALRGHLTEHGIIAPQGAFHLTDLPLRWRT